VIISNEFNAKFKYYYIFKLKINILLANYSETVVESLPADLPTGIYYGWAQVNEGDIHKMVMSIGWNPYYKNEKKSMVSLWTIFAVLV